jgi:hypothetical protein
MKEITLNTKISELLNNYEGMKDILIEINPKFKKLNNPVLRRTLAKIAGVKQAAIVGGMDPVDLLSQLRTAVGQTAVKKENIESEMIDDEIPLWISEKPKKRLNANEILDEDLNPLNVLHQAMKKVEKDDIVIVESDFRPEPLIDKYIEQGHDVYCQQLDDTQFITCIKK